MILDALCGLKIFFEFIDVDAPSELMVKPNSRKNPYTQMRRNHGL
jgi:hypothetical protein